MYCKKEHEHLGSISTPSVNWFAAHKLAARSRTLAESAPHHIYLAAAQNMM